MISRSIVGLGLLWIAIQVHSVATCSFPVDWLGSSAHAATAFAQTETQGAGETAASGIVDFHRDIAPLLRTRCQSCHQGDTPKGGFLVFDRESLLAYVSPNDIEGSSLWTDYLLQPPKEGDSESQIMPPDGPLRPSELALFKLWIEEGAVWPESTASGAVGDPSGTSATEAQGALSQQSGGANGAKAQDFKVRAYKATGYLHPAVVHFPIALLVVAGACAVLSYFLGSRCESMAFHLLWIGAVGCIFSSFAGWSFAETRGYAQWSQFPAPESTPEIKAAFAHRWLGVATTAISILAVLIAIIGYRVRSKSMTNLWLMMTLLLVVLVSFTGHKGGELVYGDIIEKIREILFD